MKAKTTLSDLTLAIRAIGMSPSNFATDKLGISYQLFRYRVRNGKLSLEDYWKILHYTGKMFEQLFPSPYTVRPKPINLTLRPAQPKIRLTPQEEEKEPVKPVPAPPKPKIEEKKEEEERSVFVDVYEGLPQIEE